MLSFTGLRNLFGELSGDATSTNLTLADTLINESIRTIATKRGGKWWWLEGTKDVDTVASQQGYEIPNSIRKLVDLYVTVGTAVYSPEAVEDPARWKEVLQGQLGTGDTPLFYYRVGNKILLAPTPATAGSTITFRGRLNVRDLNIADYTTGSIVSIANGATAIVGTGTTFTADMVGRFMRITQTSAALGGDGLWYEIGSYTSATKIGLLKPYEGTTIAAATASYTLGQVPLIPESYQMAPVYRSLALYWTIKENLARARTYWMLYDGGVEAGLATTVGGLVGQMLQESAEKVEGAYMSPFGSQNNYIDPNIPPPLATGF